MRKHNLSRIGIAGCFAASSLIGNSGCSMMQRDYFLDENGQRHEVDTSDERFYSDAGNLLILVPGGFLGALALKLAASDRAEKVRAAQQQYLIRRLKESEQNQQPRVSPPLQESPVSIYLCREWEDTNRNGIAEIGEMKGLDGLPLLLYPVISNSTEVKDAAVYRPATKFNLIMNIETKSGGEMFIDIYNVRGEIKTYSKGIDINDRSRKTFTAVFNEGLPEGLYRGQIKLNGTLINRFQLNLDKNLPPYPGVFGQKISETQPSLPTPTRPAR